MDDILSELYTLEQLKVRRLTPVDAYERLIASDKPILVASDGRDYAYEPGQRAGPENPDRPLGFY